MKVRIIYLCMYLLLSCILLTGCQTEDVYVRHSGVKSGVQFKRLKGIEARNAENLLKSKFSKSGGLQFGFGGATMRDDEPTIDFSDILLVLDTLGIKNYTFKIINHPYDDYKTFHNLVLTEKDSQLELAIMKYEMTDQFSQEYEALLKTINEFEGRITAGLASSLDPCTEIVVDYPTTNPNPVDGDDSGGSSGGEPPTNGEPPTDDDTGTDMGSGGTDCVTIEIRWVCSCGRSYPTWEAYVESECGNGMFPGYTVSLMVTYSLSACRTAEEPCSPDGSIGVLGPDKDCNKFQTRIVNVLNAEGGFTNDPTDPGGATNLGISWKVWVANAQSILGVAPTLENLQALTHTQAKLIYKTLYWDKVYCDEIDDGDLRYLLFDFYVNCGGNAVKILKKTLNSLGYNIEVNSAMDSETVEIINNHPDIISLYNSFKFERKEFYLNLVERSVNDYLNKKPNATEQQLNSRTLKKFQNGWLNRTNSFRDKTSQNPVNVNC